MLDAFHVVKLGTQVVDEVPSSTRRVRQDTLSRRGHKDDPLYKIRGLLRRGREHLSEKQVTKLNTCLIAGDPGFEVTVAWHAYQQTNHLQVAGAKGQPGMASPIGRSRCLPQSRHSWYRASLFGYRRVRHRCQMCSRQVQRPVRRSSCPGSRC